jgi:hypothetical protein
VEGALTENRPALPINWATLAAALGAALVVTASTRSAELDPRRGPPGCVPALERQMERGCYILVSQPLGELPPGPLYWHIDAFPSPAEAGAAEEPRSCSSAE